MNAESVKLPTQIIIALFLAKASANLVGTYQKVVDKRFGRIS